MGALGDTRADALHEAADAPADRAEIFAPVGVAPHLEPVDDQLVAHQWPQQGCGQQREVGEGARVHDVVTAAVAQQVPQHAEPEDERRAIRRRPVGV